MKRFLSLFLAICMVVLAVPAFMIPAFATPVEVVSRYMDASANFTCDRYEEYKNAANLSEDDYAALMQDKWKIDQGDYAWKVGKIDNTTGAFSPITRLAFFCFDHNIGGRDDGHDTTWGITEADYQTMLTEYLSHFSETNVQTTIWDKNLSLFHWTGADNAEPQLANSGATAITAMQYTVEADGVYGLSVDKFEMPTQVHYMAILVNGAMVWPKANGSLANRTDWYTLLNTTNTATAQAYLAGVGGLQLEAGDTVSFAIMGSGDSVILEPVITTYDISQVPVTLTDVYGPNSTVLNGTPGEPLTLPTYQGDLVFLGWDANGDGVADYEDGATFTVPTGIMTMSLSAIVVVPARFQDNFPTYDDKTGVVSFHGGWTIGRYATAAPHAYDLFSYSNGEHIYATEAGMWGETGGGFYLGDGKIAFSAAAAEEAFVNQIQYTTEYNGTIQIDFDQLLACRQVNPTDAAGVIAFNLAIYHNGTKIWPTDTDWFVYAGTTEYAVGAGAEEDILAIVREAGSFPLSETVKMNDTIEFRIQQGNDTSWMFYSKPTISYAEMTETPILQSASVSVGTDLGLNFYVGVISPRDNVKTGLYLWTEEQTTYNAANAIKLEAGDTVDGITRFAYRGLSAKQMTDVVYVMPYSSVEGGETIYGTVTSYSIAKYVQNAMGKDAELDKFLFALVNYGADAQSYFDYQAENPANSFLTNDQKKSNPAALTSVYAQSGTEGKIKNVSLVLDNQIGLKFMIDAKDGATSYKLQIADNEDFTDAVEITMVATEEGKEYKGITYVDFASLSKTLYVRVSVDGTAGATLTYSVASYADRVGKSTTDDSLYYLLNSMMAFGQVSAAQVAD